jgi:hypothetical protein
MLAIDEAMAGHEWVEANWRINDDYPKIVLLLATAWVLHTVYGYVGPDSEIKRLFGIGYIFQCLYIIFEISDGEFYDASAIIAVSSAKWGEELSELCFLAAYWLGFFRVHQRIVQPSPEGGDDGLPSR